MTAEIGQARTAVQSAETELTTTLVARDRALRAILPPACGILLAAALVALIAGMFRGLRYYFASAGSLILATAAALLLAVDTGVPHGAAPRAALPEVVDDLAAAVPKTAFLDGAKLAEDHFNDQDWKLRNLGDAAGAPALAKKLAGGQPLGDLAENKTGLAAAAPPAPAGLAVPPPVAAPEPSVVQGKDMLGRKAEQEFARENRDGFGVQNGARKPAEPEGRRYDFEELKKQRDKEVVRREIRDETPASAVE